MGFTWIHLNQVNVGTNVAIGCASYRLLSPAQISDRFLQADRTLVQLPIPPQSTDGGGYSVVKLSELH